MRLFARMACLVLLGAVSGLGACAALGDGLGRVDGKLAECPSAPHCVSSFATDARHAVAPFVLADPARGWAQVVAAVRAAERTTIVASDERYLHAEVISPWHLYTDDLELLLGADGRVDVRSASRIGYYDFQVNRKRVEALREVLVGAGVLASPGAGESP